MQNNSKIPCPQSTINRDKPAKSAKKAKESARASVAAHRAKVAEMGLKRVRINTGAYERDVLERIGKACGLSLSEVVTKLVGDHCDAQGNFTLPLEVGGLWESNLIQLDLTLSSDIAEALSDWPPLTSGEVLEILIGIALKPVWDLTPPTMYGEHEHGPFLQGQIVVNGQEIVPPVRMVTAYQAHWRRGESRFLQRVAMGIPAEEAWPTRWQEYDRAKALAKADWATACQRDQPKPNAVPRRALGLARKSWALARPSAVCPVATAALDVALDTYLDAA